MKRKSIVISCLLVLAVSGAFAIPGLQRSWQKNGPQPDVALDRAMRLKTIDTLVARLNNHYVFPDKAKEIGVLLHQREQEGKYDGIRNGYALARQLTVDVRGVAKDVHMKVGFHPKLVLPDEADGPAPTSQAEWEQQ